MFLFAAARFKGNRALADFWTPVALYFYGINRIESTNDNRYDVTFLRSDSFESSLTTILRSVPPLITGTKISLWSDLYPWLSFWTESSQARQRQHIPVLYTGKMSCCTALYGINTNLFNTYILGTKKRRSLFAQTFFVYKWVLMLILSCF